MLKTFKYNAHAKVPCVWHDAKPDRQLPYELQLANLFITLIMCKHLCTITKHITLETVRKLQYFIFTIRLITHEQTNTADGIHERQANLCE